MARCARVRSVGWGGAALVVLGTCIGCSPILRALPLKRAEGKWGGAVPHQTFPTDCELCHVEGDWVTIVEDFEFDHSAETGYVLEGAHAEVSCIRCHNDRGPVQDHAARGCSGCHADPHAGAFSLECESCHDQESWQSDHVFADHSTTRFPLVGSHAITPCESCHPRADSQEFGNAPTECEVCHGRAALLAEFDHLVNGWVRNCAQCHDANGWDRPRIDHGALPLSGGHAGVACTRCHAGGLVAGTPTLCFSCHQTDYTNALDHVSGNYATTCLDCHSTNDWVPL